MEKRIKEYEKFIKEAAKHPTPELRVYHNEMVRNFQHERAIHLAIMLFFIAITLIVMVGAAFSITFATIPFAVTVSILAALLFILSAAYVKHYYFLENHVQKLYDITSKLYK
jgi:heme A synthase